HPRRRPGRGSGYAQPHAEPGRQVAEVRRDMTERRISSRVRIAGTGRYLPERVMTNADLEAMVETSDEWIRTRTGIRERRIAAKDEGAADMGAAAARQALKDAGIGAEDVDLILVST